MSAAVASVTATAPSKIITRELPPVPLDKGTHSHQARRGVVSRAVGMNHGVSVMIPASGAMIHEQNVMLGVSCHVGVTRY